jgi:hypothetical protein
MSKTIITLKVKMRKNTYGIIEGPFIAPATETDRIRACHLLGDRPRSVIHEGNGHVAEASLEMFKMLASDHGWEVKLIHEPESDAPPHPLTHAE